MLAVETHGGVLLELAPPPFLVGRLDQESQRLAGREVLAAVLREGQREVLDPGVASRRAGDRAGGHALVQERHRGCDGRPGSLARQADAFRIDREVAQEVSPYPLDGVRSSPLETKQ